MNSRPDNQPQEVRGITVNKDTLVISRLGNLADITRFWQVQILAPDPGTGPLGPESWSDSGTLVPDSVPRFLYLTWG